MSTLLEKCYSIKNDKEANLKPENLKAGIVCLGVTGTLESGSGLVTEEEYNELLISANSILNDDVYREPFTLTFDSGMIESMTFDPNISRIVSTSYAWSGEDSSLIHVKDKKIGVDELQIYIYTWSYTLSAGVLATHNGVEIHNADNFAKGWYKDGVYWYVYNRDGATVEDITRYIDGISLVARTTASDNGAWTGEREEEEDDWENGLPLG